MGEEASHKRFKRRLGGAEPLRVLVAIVSYRRPMELEATLKSIRSATDHVEHGVKAVRVLVVDNDPEMTAHPVCEALGVDVVLETTPGIAAARNRALAARLQGESIAFIDDDEEATDGWLCALAGAMEGADAAFGPVLPRFAPDAPRWVVRGGFFDRRHSNSQGAPIHPATNNVMISASLLDSFPDHVFSEEFSLTGGSDTDFFARIQLRAKAKFVWVPDAVVHETVPTERANARWLWRRNVRLGNVSARVRFAGRAKAVIVLAGLARILSGVALTAGAILLRRPVARAVTQIPKGFGMLQWAAGRKTLEYARPATGK